MTIKVFILIFYVLFLFFMLLILLYTAYILSFFSVLYVFLNDFILYIDMRRNLFLCIFLIWWYFNIILLNIWNIFLYIFIFIDWLYRLWILNIYIFLNRIIKWFLFWFLFLRIFSSNLRIHIDLIYFFFFWTFKNFLETSFWNFWNMILILIIMNIWIEIKSFLYSIIIQIMRYSFGLLNIIIHIFIIILYII